MAEQVKPEQVVIEASGSKVRPFAVTLSIPGFQAKKWFETEEDAKAWANSYRFSVPSWEEVTGNGEFSAD